MTIDFSAIQVVVVIVVEMCRLSFWSGLFAGDREWVWALPLILMEKEYLEKVKIVTLGATEARADLLVSES